MSYDVPVETMQRLIDEGIYFMREVDGDSVDEFLTWIMFSRSDRSDFTLLLDNPGGSVRAALHASAVLRTMKEDFRLTGVALGTCASAALALLQCCHHRTMVRDSSLFIHEVNLASEVSAHSLDPKRMREYAKAAKLMEDEMISLQCERSGITKAAWKKLAHRGESFGSPICAPEAMKLNLVDEVVDSYPLF